VGINSNWSVGFILAAPVLQLLVAFLLMACAGTLLLLKDLQSNRASIIFIAVALAFVLELDDRIGLIMKMERPWLSGQGSHPAAPAAVAAAPPAPRPRAGYVVFGIVGWLLLCHVLLVAPQTPAQVLAFFITTFAYRAQKRPDMGVAVLHEWAFNDTDYLNGMTYNVFNDPRVRAVDYIDYNASIWNTYAFFGFAGLATLDEAGGVMGRTRGIKLCSGYLLVAVIMVLVLCHSLLPCASQHWCWALTGAGAAGHCRQHAAPDQEHVGVSRSGGPAMAACAPQPPR
jgi:hypothetical protein